MAIEGPLRELGIEDVLQLMELSRKTGILTVRSESRSDEAVLHFLEGQIVFAFRRRSMRRLGQQLLRAGKLTERELERALEIQRAQPDQKLGQILLEMGSVKEEELRRQLHFQIEETVYDLMAWEEGNFRFEDTAEVSQDYMFRIRVESLLMEGARRIDEWSRLEAKIPHLEVIPVLAEGGDLNRPVDLRPDDWEVLAELDGERDLRQIAANLGRSSFDVAKIVYGMVSAGLVEIQDRPSRVPYQHALSAGMEEIHELLGRQEWDAAARLAGELESRYADRPELPLLAGRALARQGRLRAATEAFTRAAGLDPSSAEAHYALGFAAAHIGELERAADAWQTYLRIGGDGEQENTKTETIRAALEAARTLSGILSQEQPRIDEDTRPGRLAALE